MSIDIKPEQQQFIQQQIASGRFRNADEVLEKALKLLATQYHDRENWVEDTRAKIAESQTEIDRGEGIPLEAVISQQAQLGRSRSEIEVGLKQIKAVKLLQSWIDDEDIEEQQETGQYLIRALDEDRLSDRKLFPVEMKGVTW
jgi:putative addiction module CopG family antidote